MQPWLIALDTVKRLGSRGWANLQTLSEAMDLALTGRPGLEPSSLKGRTKQEVLIVCARKPVSSKETHWVRHQEVSQSRSGGLAVEPAWRPYSSEVSKRALRPGTSQMCSRCIPRGDGVGGGDCALSSQPSHPPPEQEYTFRFSKAGSI